MSLPSSLFCIVIIILTPSISGNIRVFARVRPSDATESVLSFPATQRGRALEIAPPAGVNASGSAAGAKGAAMFAKGEGEAKSFAFDKVFQVGVAWRVFWALGRS